MNALVRTLNPALVGSVLIVSAGYIATTTILRAVLPDQEIAGALATLAFAAGPHLHRALSTRFPVATMPPPIAPAARLVIPWWILAIAAFVALALAMRVAAFGALLTFWPYGGAIVPPLATLAGIAAPAAAFLVGSMVGARAKTPALGTAALVIAVVGAFVITRALTNPVPGVVSPAGATHQPGLFDSTYCAGEWLVIASGVIAPPGEAPDPLLYMVCALQLLSDNTLLVVAAFALIGGWRGGVTREARYLTTLLNAVPVATRSAIVDLAFEEASRSRGVAPRGATSPQLPPVEGRVKPPDEARDGGSGGTPSR